MELIKNQSISYGGRTVFLNSRLFEEGIVYASRKVWKESEKPGHIGYLEVEEGI